MIQQIGRMKMDNQLKQTFGSIIQAIGTVISAVANTPNQILSDKTQDDLDIIGNVLQATGNALVADGQQLFTLSRIGNEVQAIGNTTVLAGMLISFDDLTKQTLVIKGNLLQALGGGIELGDELQEENEDSSSGQTINIIANLLQTAGNSLQAFGGIYDLQNPDGDKDYSESLSFAGSWIQAVGAVLSALEGSKIKN
jgi:hypothetical protein